MRRSYLVEFKLDIEFDHDDTDISDEEYIESRDEYEYTVDYDRLRDVLIRNVDNAIENMEFYNSISLYSTNIKVIAEKGL